MPHLRHTFKYACAFTINIMNSLLVIVCISGLEITHNSLNIPQTILTNIINQSYEYKDMLTTHKIPCLKPRALCNILEWMHSTAKLVQMKGDLWSRNQRVKKHLNWKYNLLNSYFWLCGYMAMMHWNTSKAIEKRNAF